MRPFATISVIVFLFTLSSRLGAQVPTPSLYSQRMAEAMAQGIEARYRAGDNVKAISYAIAADTFILKFGNQGEARSSQDTGGVVLMKNHPTRLITIGSISKSLAALALMHAAENDPGIDLDAPIEPYLPQKVISFIDPSIKTMTLRQLMNHTSGFRALGSGDFQSDLGYSGGAIYDNSIWRNFYYLRLGVQTANVAKYSYSNMNYALISYFFARIAYPQEAQNLENAVTYTGDPYVYFDELNKLWRPYFRQYLREHVLEPAGVDADCFYPTNDLLPVLYYTTPQSLSGHLLYDKTTEKYAGGEPGDETLTCGPGGWKLSMAELTQVMSHFASTEDIVHAESRQQIYHDHLGMFPISSNKGTAYFHNGSAGSQLNAYDIFPDGLVASLAITSTHCKVLQNGSCTEAYYDYPETGLRNAYNEALSEMQNPVCGNGILSVLEECDDENSDNTDACLDDCRLAFCGDGFLREGIEICDEGELNGQAGHCNTSCSGEASLCGDQVVQNPEDCIEVPSEDPGTSGGGSENPPDEEPTSEIPTETPTPQLPSGEPENPEPVNPQNPESLAEQNIGACDLHPENRGQTPLLFWGMFFILTGAINLWQRRDAKRPDAK